MKEQTSPELSSCGQGTHFSGMSELVECPVPSRKWIGSTPQGVSPKNSHCSSDPPVRVSHVTAWPSPTHSNHLFIFPRSQKSHHRCPISFPLNFPLTLKSSGTTNSFCFCLCFFSFLNSYGPFFPIIFHYHNTFFPPYPLVMTNIANWKMDHRNTWFTDSNSDLPWLC